MYPPEVWRETIRRMCASSGLTPSKLTSEAGGDASSLYKFLRGTRRGVRLDTLGRYAQAAGWDRQRLAAEVEAASRALTS